MNKTCSPSILKQVAVAATLCCAGLASAQSSVTLYGIVDAAVVVTSNQAGGTKTAVEAGQLATSRWGFKGTEDLGGGLKANFNLESTLVNDTGAAGYPAPQLSLFDRMSTVGLSGGFGSVNIGRQNMLGVDSIGQADPIGLAHAANNPNVYYSVLNERTVAGSFGANGLMTELRQNNSIKYLTPMFGGFGGAAMVGVGEKTGNSGANRYTGLSGYYTDGKSGAALAYAKLTDAANTSTMTLLGGGAKYVMGPVTFKGTYAQSEVDAASAATIVSGPILANRKIRVTGLGVDYALSVGNTLTAAYYNTKGDNLVVAGDSGKADQYVLLGKMALSKRTVLYSSLSLIKADSNSVADRSMSSGMVVAGETDATRFALGVLHSF